MTGRRALGILAPLLLSVASACVGLPIGPRALSVCEGPLLATDDMGGDFVIQQRWRVIATGVDFPLHGVLEKRGDELVLIGMNAFGAKLFTLAQTGTDLQVQAAPPALLPVPPQNLLRDLHRVLFLSAEKPAAGSGESVRTLFSERIFDRWVDGELARRDFLRERQSSVQLDFSRDAGKQRVVLRNPGCGYTLEIDWISEQRS